MIARLALSVALPGLIPAIGFRAEVLNLGLIETLAVTSLIIGFAVAAAGWTVRTEIEAVRLIGHDHVRVGFAVDSPRRPARVRNGSTR
ncbi:hypothetical protein WN73_12525 [Bradyrhizobium sp. CCBAU 45394]|nr:hypothetical protein [Bradyrhizobium sp. CCBAU 45394]MDA9537174.1 hypothetical protein [Bradyrhizobium sp. CCBAU 21362]